MIVHVKTGYWGSSTRRYFLNLEELCHMYGRKTPDKVLEYPLNKAKKLLNLLSMDIDDADQSAEDIQEYLDKHCSKYAEIFRKEMIKRKS